jgi:FkbM family methyltransferase
MNRYSQFGEEEIIQNYFDKDYISGCIDVGASDGVAISNTLLFEQLGWYCLCIEPNPFYFKQLKQNRLNTVNYAISNVNDDLPFNIVDFGNHHEDAISGLKTDERLIVQHKNMGFNIDIRKIIVEVITLDKCIEDFYKYDKIDFISIDTEGTELDVLKGFSIEKWNPKLLIIENNFEDPEIEEYLKQYDYKKDKRIGVNDFYIKKYINN